MVIVVGCGCHLDVWACGGDSNGFNGDGVVVLLLRETLSSFGGVAFCREGGVDH